MHPEQLSARTPRSSPRIRNNSHRECGARVVENTIGHVSEQDIGADIVFGRIFTTGKDQIVSVAEQIDPFVPSSLRDDTQEG